MTAMTFSVGRKLALLSALAIVVSAQWYPLHAQVCANDSNRTIFTGGPGTEACFTISDQATCARAFHRSGAGQFAPCAWNGISCEGNTRGEHSDVAQTCETLPDPATCIDPTRTLKLTNTSTGPNTGDSVCQSLSDEETCESAWHVGAKAVGIACCWEENEGRCLGSAWGFNNGECTHGNTCFASTSQTAAPAVRTLGLFVAGAVLLLFGITQLSTKR
jgi:hypothetical protein